MVQEFFNEIEGMVDFKIQEVSDNVTLFLFNPQLYKVDARKAADLIAILPHVDDVVVEVNTTELPRGLITLFINPVEEHYLTSKLIKECIANFILECKYDDDN